MGRKIATFWVFAALCLSAVPAQAGSIFLNGINIDGVTNQVIPSANVEIDGQGNVYIVAKDYALINGRIQRIDRSAQQRKSPATTGGAPSRRYWLVTEKAAPGMSQYDIDLYINAQWVRKFLDREEHVVMEITKYLRTGDNKVHLVAKKDLAGGRRSTSPQHYFRIVVGEGDSGGRQVMITRKAIDYKRSALETKDFKDEFNLVVR